MKQAIITGGAGFIGSFLTRYLLLQGVEVIALGRKDFSDIDPRRKELIKGARYLCLDLSDADSLSKLLEDEGVGVSKGTVFYHLAWWGRERLSDLDVEAQMKNVGFSMRVLQAAAKLGCKRFVHVGSMEEGFSKAYFPLDFRENTEYNRHLVYATAKIISKDFLKIQYQNLKGIDLLFANNSHVMGPLDDKDSFLQVTLQKLMDGGDLIFSTGEQYFDCVSVYDLARAYYHIGISGRNGIEYWVGSGNPRRLRSYVEEMYELYPSGKPMQFGKMPYNDRSLQPKDFSIEALTRDTEFRPQNSYADTVRNLHSFLSTGAVKELFQS
jgi:nucleoside-diphosphate-sugar epimerase